MLFQQMLLVVLIIIMDDDESLHDSLFFRTMQSGQVCLDISRVTLSLLLYKKYMTMP